MVHKQPPCAKIGGKSVQNRGQSVILSGENHHLPYTIIGGVSAFRDQGEAIWPDYLDNQQTTRWMRIQTPPESITDKMESVTIVKTTGIVKWR